MNPGVEDTRVSIISEAAKHFGIVQRNQVRAEVKELPSILGEKELPENLVPCQNSFGMGLLVATNQRLVYLNKLPLGSLQIENYRYDDITSIEFKTTTLIRGVLRISVSGDRKEFANVPKKLINAFAEHLRTKVPPENLLPDPEDSGPAPSPELAEAISAAAQELGSSYRATVKKELDELPSILGEEELPEKMMVGWYDGGEGLLVATDERLIFSTNADLLAFGLSTSSTRTLLRSNPKQGWSPVA